MLSTDIYNLPTPQNSHYFHRYIKLLNICESQLVNSTFEKHHIIPKSMGGDNSIDNIIKLSPRQHFIAHWLLWKAYANVEMAHAFWMMCNKQKTNSRVYEKLKNNRSELYSGENHPYYGKSRPEHSEKMTGENNPMYGVRLLGEANGFYGKSHTQELKQQWREARLNKSWEDLYGEIRAKEMRINRSASCQGENNPFYGKHHNEETLVKMRIVAANRLKIECPHCGKIMDQGNVKRWHFDNCKTLK